jgi:hypothetical protein
VADGRALVKLASKPNAPLGMIRIDAEFGSEASGSVPPWCRSIISSPTAHACRSILSWKVEAADSKATVTGSATVQYLYGIGERRRSGRRTRRRRGRAEFLLRRGTTPVKGCYDSYTFGPGDENSSRPLAQDAGSGQRRSEPPFIGVTLDSVPEAQHPRPQRGISAFDQAGVLARRSRPRPAQAQVIGVKLLKTKRWPAAAGRLRFPGARCRNPRSRQMLKFNSCPSGTISSG